MTRSPKLSGQDRLACLTHHRLLINKLIKSIEAGILTHMDCAKVISALKIQYKQMGAREVSPSLGAALLSSFHKDAQEQVIIDRVQELQSAGVDMRRLIAVGPSRVAYGYDLSYDDLSDTFTAQRSKVKNQLEMPLDQADKSLEAEMLDALESIGHDGLVKIAKAFSDISDVLNAFSQAGNKENFIKFIEKLG